MNPRLTSKCIVPIIHLLSFEVVHMVVHGFERPESGSVPVYLQIIRQFKLLVLQGRLANGDEVPSRRMLAAQMGVNPNTVQKAFAEFEKEGLIITPPNAKSVVNADEEALERLQAEILEGQVSALVDAAMGAGLGCEQLVDMVNTDWKCKATLLDDLAERRLFGGMMK